VTETTPTYGGRKKTSRHENKGTRKLKTNKRRTSRTHLRISPTQMRRIDGVRCRAESCKHGSNCMGHRLRRSWRE
jgi:hypothetical protein